MHTVESIAQEIAALEPSAGLSRRAFTIVDSRLHCARGPNDALELFIEGTKESFGHSAIGRSLDWGIYHDQTTDRTFSALVVRAAPWGAVLRVMAHLAYEAGRLASEKPAIANDELLQQLTLFIELVVQPAVLSVKSQMGLVGELMFLTELVNFSARQTPVIDARLAVLAWKGWQSAARDYYNGSIAVEVKATANASRIHRIGSLNQLVPRPEEGLLSIYVYSVGLRPDSSSHYRLITAFDRLCSSLTMAGREILLTALSKYRESGFDESMRSRYELEPGFVVSLQPQLFRVDNVPEILRRESFANGRLPARVVNIEYDVTLEGLQPVDTALREQIMRMLVLGENR